MPPVLPHDPSFLQNLQPSRSYVDIDWRNSRLSGWILTPDHELDSVRVFANGTLAGVAEIIGNEEAAQQYPNIPHAARSGFQITARPETLRRDAINPICVLGYHHGEPTARRDTIVFHDELIPRLPTPPAELIEKSQGGRDGKLYHVLGYRYYHQLHAAIARQREALSPRRILDLGCGSGRVLAHFLQERDRHTVAGADIDVDAIRWCRANLPKAEFSVIQPAPPLPYPTAAFDVAISLAVFAGYGPEYQAVWLAELKRVIAPGGLLLVSIQSAFSASFFHPPLFMSELDRAGIITQDHYESLAATWGLRAYLGVYQTRAYTWREWSRCFEIVEHLEGEINADQDLVVLQRRH